MTTSSITSLRKAALTLSDQHGKAEIVRERTLRDEIRHLHLIYMRIMHWGVTVEASAQMLLYFVRREATDLLQEQGKLAAGMPLPLNRYLLGTGFLFVLALVFFGMSYAVTTRLTYYREQLCPNSDVPTPCGIYEMGPRKHFRYMALSLYFVFPLFDIAVRMYLHLSMV